MPFLMYLNVRVHFERNKSFDFVITVEDLNLSNTM